MIDPLKKHLDKLKIIAESAKRRNNMYTDLAKLDNRQAKRSLSALHNAPAPGKKIQKIRFIMLWIPEPTGVTCAVGGPMILAGRYLDKVYNGSKLSDIAHQTNSTVSTIHDFKRSIM